MPSDDPLQHLSRAAGLAAYTLLWFDMCLGIALSGGVQARVLPRWRVGDLHQFTGLLSLGLVATHILVLVGMRHNAFTLQEMFVPLVRQLNPPAPTLGICGLYLLILVAVVSHARRHVARRVWRAIHTFSFFAFALALMHAIVAGPDTFEPWLRALYIGTLSILLALIVTRIRDDYARARARVSPGRPLTSM
jgi:methionine sulfoxide reductase heme-binding subunit